MAEDRELSREEKIAAARAKVEAIKRQRAAAQAGQAAAAPQAAAARTLEVPVSSVNPGGRPVDTIAGRTVVAYGTVNQAVDIVGGPEDQENLKKLLGGISGYPNPLRRNAIQVDYRYYREARRRLEAAGYRVEERDYLGRSLSEWTPERRGWTRVD